MFLDVLSIYLFCATLISALFASFVLSKGSTPLIRLFFFLCLGTSIYLFAYTMELNSVDLERMEFWNQVQYLFIPFYPAIWLLLSAAYAKVRVLLRPASVVATFVVPSATFVIHLTNKLHGLYYTYAAIRETPSFPIMVLGKGPWYAVQGVYLVLCFLVSGVFYVTRFRALSVKRRGARVFLLLAAAMPMLGLLLILMDGGRLGLDYTAFLAPLGLAFLLLAMLRYDFLSVRTLARGMLFESSANPMIVVDEGLTFMDRSTEAFRLFPELEGSRVGQPLMDLLGGRPELVSRLAEMVQGTASGDWAFEGHDGRLYELEFRGIEDKNRRRAGSLLQFYDRTEERANRERLLRRASTDALTSALNRGAFMERAEEEFRGTMAGGPDFSLAMLDVDHFKVINDSYGHPCGDASLRALVGILFSRLRRTDILGRVGGEEFCVILPGTEGESAFAACEKLRRSVAEARVDCEGTAVRMTVSVGVASAREGFPDVQALLSAADRRLYISKREGRNRVTGKDEPGAGDAAGRA